MENYSSLHQVCIQVFEAVSKTTSIFVVPFFMMRIVFSNILGEGSKVFEILKNTVLYFCLVSAFPLIIELLFSIPEAYLPRAEYMNAAAMNTPGWNPSSLIPFAVDRILEVLLAGLYWLAYYLHNFFMIVMCSMAPIVFLSSTLLGLGLGLEIFLGLLIAGSSWPIIWYGFDQVHAQLVSAQTDQFGAKCLELLLTLFKAIAPVAFASVAIKSPPGKVIAAAARGTFSVTQWGAGMRSSGKNYGPAAYSWENSKSSTHSQRREQNSYQSKYAFNDSSRLKKARKQNLEENRSISKDKADENSRRRDI